MTIAVTTTIIALDDNMNAIGVVNEYDGLVWTARLLEHSEFSLQTTELGALAGAKYLIRNDAPEVMKVESLTYDGKKWEVAGREATCLFEWRVIFGNVQHSSDAQVSTVANSLFASAFGAAGSFATAEQRAYENYEHATLSTEASISVGNGYSRSWGSLWNALYDLLNPYFLGFRTVINTTSGKLNAEIIEYELEDGIVFAVSLNDVVSFKRSISLADYCTRAFITGEYDNGISDNPTPVIEFASSDGLRINQDEGFDAMLFPVWREQYIDGGGVDSVDDEDNTLTNAQFRNALKRLGIESLLANKYENVMTVNVDESRHVYRNDYRIGSIVGYQVDALFSGYDIIREVTETIERGARSIYITLGQTAPTIKQLIRSK